MRQDFEARLQAYFAGCQQRFHAPTREIDDDPAYAPRPWRIDRLKKWVRIVGPQRVHSFVDIETGEVYKPGGFDRPAITKTKRGNIFDEHNGLANVGPYGIAYAQNIKDKETGAVRPKKPQLVARGAWITGEGKPK
jgi:hypothetical protein